MRALQTALLLSLACSSSPAPAPACTADTCLGCCDSDGVCEVGDTVDACGQAGNACATCSGACAAGGCISPDAGTLPDAGCACSQFETCQNGGCVPVTVTASISYWYAPPPLGGGSCGGATGSVCYSGANAQCNRSAQMTLEHWSSIVGHYSACSVTGYAINCTNSCTGYSEQYCCPSAGAHCCSYTTYGCAAPYGGDAFSCAWSP